MKDITSDKVIWSQDNYSTNNFSFSNISSTESSLVPGSEYQIELTLSNNSVFSYNFMVLIDQDETDALKSIIE